MTHQEIENRGWVEAYVRRRLPASDAAAFEEHYFQCDRCFSDVRAMEKFVAGVTYAGRRGLLDPKPERATWFMPAFAFAAALSLILASGLAFLAFVRLPDREARLRQALAQAEASQARIAQLDQRAALDSAPQANVPVVILQANRGAEPPNRLLVDSQTRTAMLWLDVPPQPPGTKFGLTISTPGDRESMAIHGLERNPNGALAVSLPVHQLANSSYIVRLYLDKPSAPILAEYRLAVVRR